MVFRPEIEDANRNDRRACPRCGTVMHVIGHSSDLMTEQLRCPSCGDEKEVGSNYHSLKFGLKAGWEVFKRATGI